MPSPVGIGPPGTVTPPRAAPETGVSGPSSEIKWEGLVAPIRVVRAWCLLTLKRRAA